MFLLVLIAICDGSIEEQRSDADEVYLWWQED